MADIFSNKSNPRTKLDRLPWLKYFYMNKLENHLYVHLKKNFGSQSWSLKDVDLLLSHKLKNNTSTFIKMLNDIVRVISLFKKIQHKIFRYFPWLPRIIVWKTFSSKWTLKNTFSSPKPISRSKNLIAFKFFETRETLSNHSKSFLDELWLL